jgi:hypothetical protein
MSKSKPTVDDGWDIGRIGLCALTIAALLFGGANRFDVMAPIVPRMIAIALLAWALWSGALGLRQWSWLEKTIWLLIFAVPLIQLIPLPYGTWSALPGREFPRDLYAALTLAPAQPLSLAPDRTINALLALLPPFAAYVLARGSDGGLFGLIVRIIAIFALGNAVLGLAQVGAGVGALRPYVITNGDLAVGLFANANHLGSLLVVGMFAVALWIRDAINAPTHAAGNPQLLALIGGVIVMLAALWFSNSRAAMLILTLATLLGAMAACAGRLGWSAGRTLVILGGVGTVTLLAFILLTPQSTLTSLAALMGSDDRARNLPIFLRMIADLFPYGTGMGSFDGIFKAYEPVENLSPAYLNNAHMDYAQLLIEAGVAGAVGLLLFGLWWAGGALNFVRRGAVTGDSDRAFDLFALAGTGVYLVHSLGDYPLRATANAVVFAILCARIAQSRNRAIPV